MKTHQLIRYLFLIIPLGVILSTPQNRGLPGFFSDEAVYFSMIMSLANHGDLTWTRNDLETVCQLYPAGPVGVILRKNANGNIVYAKPIIYPVFAAPFYLLFGPNGILCLNFLCFWLILRWLSMMWGNSTKSTLIAMGVLTFSAFIPYTLWIHPEMFTAFLVAGFSMNWMCRKNKKASYLWMAIFIALATAIKPNLILLGLPVILSVFTKRKFKELAVFIALAISILSATYLFSGQINPYKGNRKIFHTEFPKDTEQDAFGSGDSWSSAKARFYFNSNVFGWNLFYFLFGRFTGIFWYFFPGVWLALSALITKNNRDGRMLLLTCCFISIVQIVLIPTNYHGGGGALGNRYFIYLYPMLLFSLPRLPKSKFLLPVLSFSAVLSGAFLIHPWNSSYQPGEFTKKGLHSLLPVEWTLTGAFPIFDADYYRVTFAGVEGEFFFLDRNAFEKSENGFSVESGKTSRILLELPNPVDNLNIFLQSTQDVISGTIRAQSKTTDFLATSTQHSRIMVEMGQGHHRTNIHGLDRWIYEVIITCQPVKNLDNTDTLTPGSVRFSFQPYKTKTKNRVLFKQKSPLKP